MRRPLFRQVTIIGLGLIGGSLGLALRRRGAAGRVVGVARRAATLAQARRAGAIDRGFTALAPAVAAADLVVIATPPSTVVPMARRVAAATAHAFLLTDAASAKSAIVRGWSRALPNRIRAVGSHPMAGSERSGIAAASAELFEGAWCALTPAPGTPRRAVRQVAALWRAVGMRTSRMTPERHDTIVAMISHTPHVVAASLVAAATAEETALAATGFADMTRVALGDPALWQDICLSNRDALLAALGRFERTLVHLRQAIAYRDAEELRKTLAASRRARQRLCR
ncbi:MAG: prephenate dehydrogenase/arogenate dehydrogenase family protein [Candidatus Omnitrophica bacterium]|nr:prephenate dehydrogenase/arogenate dehydrogenase family protein [Candidatus Omnitrophota bacterium]